MKYPRNHKLSVVEVRLIRKSRKPARDLAERYGVHIGTISNIRRGKTWGHVK